jgi:hypothetical protein
MELGDPSSLVEMDQDPKLTLEWALRCLERALGNLDDGPAERRVRRQFHQLLLAIEREAGDVGAPYCETSLNFEPRVGSMPRA